MLVHFPIALVIFGFLAEMFALLYKNEDWLKIAGFYLLIFGTVSALLASFSGLFFTKEVTGLAIDVEERHEMFAWITAAMLFITSTIRILMEEKQNQKLKTIMLIFYGLSVLSVVTTGLIKGILVYDYILAK